VFAGEAGLGGLQESFVVALGEVGLVVGAARFIAQNRALDDDAGELEHVVKLTRKGWTETIDKMKALGAQGTSQEFEAILDYLSTHFKGEIDEALDLNSAEALDLESVLQLLRRESAAFLQFRSTRGPFASMSDLKDLNPVILKKIEAKKDRVVFRSK